MFSSGALTPEGVDAHFSAACKADLIYAGFCHG
jgi:hypothetical protein